MDLLMEAMRSLGAVLLQVVAALLLEELTFGGLVRLLIAPKPGTGKHGVPGDGFSSLGCKHGVPGDGFSSLGCKAKEHHHQKGESKCSH